MSTALKPHRLWFRGEDDQVKTAVIIGRHGFLGSALAAKLGGIVSSFPTRDTRVLFYLGGHTHPVFEQNPENEMEAVFHDFIKYLPMCARNADSGTLFVYASSALVYEKDTQFAKFKRTLEGIASCYEKTRTLCLRIFPVYGPGENHTFISKSCDAMKAGKRPIVYGDGTQARDFIFIDDVVDQILAAVDDCQWKQSTTADIGTGELKTFNSIIEMINAQLGTSIEPQYIRAPFGYSQGIACQNPGEVKVSMEEGVKRMLNAAI